jgi:hypothetical protein
LKIPEFITLRYSSVLRWSALHLGLCIFTWMWFAGLALSFDDPKTRGVWYQIQHLVVPNLALGLTMPGRLFWGGDGALMPVAFLLNSLLWGVMTAFVAYKLRIKIGKAKLN